MSKIKNDRRKVVFIAVTMIVFGLAFTLGKSYAYFETSIVGSNITIGVGKLIHSLKSDVRLKAGEKKQIELIVESNDDIASKYQVYYKSNDGLTDVLIGYSSNSVDLPSGEIEARGVRSITIVFYNNSLNDVSINVGVRAGLNKNSVEDIILGDGENRVVQELEGISEDELTCDTTGTATAELITEGYTAWVNGQLIVGTRPLPVNSLTGSFSLGSLNSGGDYTYHVEFEEPFDVVPTVTATTNFNWRTGSGKLNDGTSGDHLYTSCLNVTRTGFDILLQCRPYYNLYASDIKTTWSATIG